MTEYHYMYVVSNDHQLLNEYSRKIADRFIKKGGEAQGPYTMESASPVVVWQVLNGREPEDKMHNWIPYIDESILEELKNEKLFGHTIRFTGLEGVDMSEVFDIPDEIHVHVRTRIAGHDNEFAPFSYNPNDDYYTEPDDPEPPES